MLRRALAGDRRALEELGHWLTHELHETFSRSRDVPDAWELTQATSLRVLANLEQAPALPANFRRWVMGFISNGINRQREEFGRERARRAKILIHLVERDLEPGVDLEREFGSHEMRAFLERQIEELPPAYQNVVRLRLCDYSFASIAARSGISPGTARRYLWLGIRRLREAVERERATRPRYRSPAS